MKSQDVRQFDAFSVPAPTPGPVAESIVRSQPDFTAALMLSIAASGLDDKQIYGPLGVDHAQWSRVRSRQANFPMDKLATFCRIVGNDIPLHWLAYQQGYELKPLATDLERRVAELESALAQERRDRETILRFVKEARL